MAAIREGSCHDDSDCPEKQYCYRISKTCVDYTECSRYKRKENGDKKSREPSQCGPCYSGYTAEKLGTGEMAQVCTKTNAEQDVPEISQLDNNIIIYIAMGLSLILILGILAAFITRFVKRRTSGRRSRSPICDVVPTAPPLGNNPFLDIEAASSLVPFNNNKNLKDKNNLVRAGVYMPPGWVRTNPNYENDLNNDNVDAAEQLQSTVEHPIDDQSNDWTTEQLTLEVPNGNLVGYELERMNHSISAVLIEADDPASSNANENNSNNSSNNTNSNGSTSQSSNAQNSRERVRASNILISQKISMNVNLLNGDC